VSYVHPHYLNAISKLQKGASSARSDDTQSLKSAIIDWIMPHGEALTPPIARNIKLDRRFNHKRTGFLLCPAGLDWTDPEYPSLIAQTDNNISHLFRVKNMLRSQEYVVQGDQWPLLLYKNYIYDGENPWKGLLRSHLLVSVSICAFPCSFPWC
jgi:hypothetical protein